MNNIPQIIQIQGTYQGAFDHAKKLAELGVPKIIIADDIPGRAEEFIRSHGTVIPGLHLATKQDVGHPIVFSGNTTGVDRHLENAMNNGSRRFIVDRFDLLSEKRAGELIELAQKTGSVINILQILKESSAFQKAITYLQENNLVVRRIVVKYGKDRTIEKPRASQGASVEVMPHVWYIAKGLASVNQNITAILGGYTTVQRFPFVNKDIQDKARIQDLSFVETPDSSIQTVLSLGTDIRQEVSMLLSGSYLDTMQEREFEIYAYPLDDLTGQGHWIKISFDEKNPNSTKGRSDLHIDTFQVGKIGQLNPSESSSLPIVSDKMLSFERAWLEGDKCNRLPTLKDGFEAIKANFTIRGINGNGGVIPYTKL